MSTYKNFKRGLKSAHLGWHDAKRSYDKASLAFDDLNEDVDEAFMEIRQEEENASHQPGAQHHVGSDEPAVLWLRSNEDLDDHLEWSDIEEPSLPGEEEGGNLADQLASYKRPPRGSHPRRQNIRCSQKQRQSGEKDLLLKTLDDLGVVAPFINNSEPAAADGKRASLHSNVPISILRAMVDSVARMNDEQRRHHELDDVENAQSANDVDADMGRRLGSDFFPPTFSACYGPPSNAMTNLPADCWGVIGTYMDVKSLLCMSNASKWTQWILNEHCREGWKAAWSVAMVSMNWSGCGSDRVRVARLHYYHGRRGDLFYNTPNRIFCWSWSASLKHAIRETICEDYMSRIQRNYHYMREVEALAKLTKALRQTEVSAWLDLFDTTTNPLVKQWARYQANRSAGMSCIALAAFSEFPFDEVENSLGMSLTRKLRIPVGAEDSPNRISQTLRQLRLASLDSRIENEFDVTEIHPNDVLQDPSSGDDQVTASSPTIARCISVRWKNGDEDGTFSKLIHNPRNSKHPSRGSGYTHRAGCHWGRPGEKRFTEKPVAKQIKNIGTCVDKLRSKSSPLSYKEHLLLDSCFDIKSNVAKGYFGTAAQEIVRCPYHKSAREWAYIHYPHIK